MSVAETWLCLCSEITCDQSVTRGLRTHVAWHLWESRSGVYFKEQEAGLFYPQDANVGLSANGDREAAAAERAGPFRPGFNGFLQADWERDGGLFLKSNPKGLSSMNNSFLPLFDVLIRAWRASDSDVDEVSVARSDCKIVDRQRC